MDKEFVMYMSAIIVTFVICLFAGMASANSFEQMIEVNPVPDCGDDGCDPPIYGDDDDDYEDDDYEDDDYEDDDDDEDY